MFTTLVVFLPGNVILYSYVNCDALAMCSTAIIFYSWVKAYKEGFTVTAHDSLEEWHCFTATLA